MITLAQGQEWTDGTTTWRIVSKKGNRLIIVRLLPDGTVTDDSLTLRDVMFLHKIEAHQLRLIVLPYEDDLPW